MVTNENVDRLATGRMIILDRVDVVLCLTELSAGLAGTRLQGDDEGCGEFLPERKNRGKATLQHKAWHKYPPDLVE